MDGWAPLINSQTTTPPAPQNQPEIYHFEKLIKSSSFWLKINQTGLEGVCFKGIPGLKLEINI
jgi:hypothetical protein